MMLLVGVAAVLRMMMICSLAIFLIRTLRVWVGCFVSSFEVKKIRKKTYRRFTKLEGNPSRAFPYKICREDT